MAENAGASTTKAADGTVMVPVNSRIILSLVVLFGGGVLGGGGTTALFKGEIPVEIKLSIDEATKATREANTRLAEMQRAVDRMEARSGGFDKDVQRLESGYVELERRVRDLERRPR